MVSCDIRLSARLARLSARLAAHLGHRRVACARGVHACAAQQQQQQAEAAAERRRQAAPAGGSLSIVAASPTATQLLAAYFACELHPSDCYLLYGSVGAGKSYFSRAFIRAAADDDELPVPSPTFLLQHIYTDHKGPPIHHFDLYRLTNVRDLARLDLPASFAQAVCLVEWPERLAGGEQGEAPQPTEPLDVHISILQPAEQEALQMRLLAARRRGGGGSGGRSAGAAAGAAAEEEEWAGAGSSGSSDDEDDDEGGGDARWRRIQLSPAGPRWQPRLQLLRRYLQAEGGAVGCYLEAEGGGPQP